MPEILDKDALDFLTRFLGGTASAATQLVMAWYYQTNPGARNQFPFTRPMEQLPFWADIIVGGISIGEALAGLGIEDDPLKVLGAMSPQVKEFGKGLRKFGEGGILYSVPMLTQTTIVHNVPKPTAGYIPTGPPASSPSPSARGIVYKL